MTDIVPIDEVYHFDVITSNPSTGAVSDADSTPTFEVFEESTDTDIGVGGNLTKRTSKTGNYRGSFTASAANGFEAGKWYAVIASATVNSVAGKAVAARFRCVPAENVAGVPVVDPSHWGGTAVASALVRGNVIQVEGTDATDYYAGLDDAVLAAVAALNNLDAAGIRTAVGLASANLDTQLAAVQADTDNIQTRLPAALVSGRMDSSVGEYQTGLTPLQPTVAGRTLDVTATGEAGVDLDNTAGTLAKGTDLTGFNDLDAAGVRTAVGLASANLDTQLAAADDAILAVIGAAGAGLTAIPWNAAWDAEVESEATDALNAYDPPTKAEIDSGLAALNDLDAAGVRTAIGLASANLDTQLGDLPTNAELTAALAAADDAVLAAIAALNNLSAADIRVAVGLASANLDTQLDALPTAAENADAVHDEVIDGVRTLRQLTRGFAAALLGKASGMEDFAPVFRNIADSKDVITATTDADGNRTAVTLDLT